MLKRTMTTIIISLLAVPCALAFWWAAEGASVCAAEGDGLYCLCGGERINVVEKNGESYLFLPSGADLQNVSLESDGEGRVVRFSQDGGELSDHADLTAMTPKDGVYSLEAVIADDDSFTLRVMAGSNIGTVYYHSSDPAGGGREYIDQSKKRRGSGTAVVTDSGGTVINSKAKNQVVTKFHSRGNTSFRDPRKSYQLKFDKKIALIDGTGEAKKWVLLAQHKDPLRISDKIIKDIGSLIAGRYDPARFSPREDFVNFYYDGEYRGVYLLSEKNEIGASRVDIRDLEKIYEAGDESYGTANTDTAENRYGNTYRYQKNLTDPGDLDGYGGFLLDLNASRGSEANWFTFTSGLGPRAVNLNSPELGSRSQVRYISEYFQVFSDALAGEGIDGKRTGRNPDTGLYYYDYCDPDSLADQYILNMISANGDGFHRSLYFYKDAGGKMYAGPVWDMDLSFGTGYSVRISPTRNILPERALSMDLIRIPGFQARLKERYFSEYEPLLQTLAYGGSGGPIRSLSDTVDLIADDLAMDWTLWPQRYRVGKGTKLWPESASLEDIASDRLTWLRERKAFLDSLFGELDPAHDHVFGKATPTSAQTHTRTCTDAACGETVEEACLFICRPLGDGTHAARCEVCGNSRAAEPCRWDNGVIDTAPTCVSGGLITYTCSKCGDTRTEALPADPEAHDWDEGVITKNPSASAPGIITYTCSLCGKTRTETVPGEEEAAPTTAKTKAANPMTARGKRVKLKAETLTKKKVRISAPRAYSITGAKGKLTYAKVKLNRKKYGKKFLVNRSTGTITVKKGVKKGVYKLTVKIRAAGDRNYVPASKVVKVRIQVK